MAAWILKTEPEVYSIDDLARDKRTPWNGIRNFQAQKNLKAMAVGDRALIYHTGGVRMVVGEARVTQVAHPEKAGAPWVQVEIAYVRKLPRPVPLSDIKERAQFKNLALVKQGRLSVSPCLDKEYTQIVEMGE